MNNLTNAFHTVAAFFSGQAPGSTDMPFTFEAESYGDGVLVDYSTYVVPGLRRDVLDFAPTDAVSSFVRTSAGVSWQDDPIGGGFGETRLSLLCGYGTGVRVVPDEEIDALIASGNIHQLLLDPPHYHLRRALKDRYVFRVSQSAITQHNFRFEAINEPNLKNTEVGLATSGGQYWSINPNLPKLWIATIAEPDFIKETIQHELLHYVFDKSANILGNVIVEAPTLDSELIAEDHFVIEQVMEKLKVQTLCKKGLIGHLSRPMWSANIYRFTVNFDVPFLMQIEKHDRLGEFVPTLKFSLKSIGGLRLDALQTARSTAWNNDDHSGVMSVLDDPDFASAAVAAQLIPLLPQPGLPELESIPLLFTPEMYQDMAFLNAQRYAMYVHGIYELSLVSKREGKPMTILFKDADKSGGAMLRNFGWAARMDAFFVEFFEALITDPMEGVLAIERRLRKP
ncbi:MAG: hypothetical protein WA071_26780 [Undibacterium umbellatum]|uniref:hypothetical protein n=1 Tax=Undibacterium umbellatum TaxID=2762300 RepID=UPI003BB7EC21